MLQFQSEDEAVFAMFDGGHNNEVPKRLLRIVPEVLKEELIHHRTGDKYMKYTMLSSHRFVLTTNFVVIKCDFSLENFDWKQTNTFLLKFF